ncbi:MBL fold metallo-hydrolase [Anaerosporobacter sp.]|uniref:MBL fold metallo-hydrolase n=1 Tax=Anaerosporobacter sp. TaxID=1872529 RepID=UPI0028A08A82|nr:MBL fold metallo-hydrolase [Anaerosporobacter sp.]
MNINVQYIKHSCYLVELANVYLLFDYYTGEIPKLSSSKPVYAFASHFHEDHFSFSLFSKLADVSNVQYILSNDIKKKYSKNYFLKKGVTEEIYESINFIAPDMDITIDDFHIRTLDSTDCGVAFIIETTEETIYHAGDLNLWTWEGNTAQENEEITEAFQAEIAKLEGMHIDLAFLPLDPRQENHFHLGFDYFMNQVDVSSAYAMHCWDDFSVIPKLKSMDCSKSYYHKIRN